MILTNALVVPMTENRKSFRGYVRVKQGSIAEVGEGSPTTIDPNEETVDGAGCVLLPGLINAHTHLIKSCCAPYGRISRFYAGSSGSMAQRRFFGQSTSMPVRCWVVSKPFKAASRRFASIIFSIPTRSARSKPCVRYGIPGCVPFLQEPLWTPAKSSQTA